MEGTSEERISAAAFALNSADVPSEAVWVQIT